MNVKNERKDRVQDNRLTLLQMITDEITFLNSCFNGLCREERQQRVVRDSIEVLETLLRIQGNLDIPLADDEFLDLVEEVMDAVAPVMAELSQQRDRIGVSKQESSTVGT